MSYMALQRAFSKTGAKAARSTKRNGLPMLAIGKLKVFLLAMSGYFCIDRLETYSGGCGGWWFRGDAK